MIARSVRAEALRRHFCWPGRASRRRWAPRPPRCLFRKSSGAKGRHL